MANRMKTRSRGFTLLEMMAALAVLTIVLGVVFSQIMSIQKRYKSEEGKLDVVQETREFMEQFARDLHQAGYPNLHSYSYGTYDNTSQNVAAGIVQFSGTTVWFEGDVDGDGNVESVQYSVVAGSGGACPCTISRAMIRKVNGTAPQAQVVSGNANTALRGVMNGQPFTAFDQNGSAVAATDITQTDPGTGLPRTYNIRSIRIAVNVRTRTPDANGYSPVINMTSTGRVNTPLF